jgi:molybdopterin converting factor small subunit
VPTALRELVAGERSVVVEVGDGLAGDDPVTVASVLDALAADHPALGRRLRDEQGRTRVHVNLFVGADNVRDRDGLSTPVQPGEELSIIPAISGG